VKCKHKSSTAFHVTAACYDCGEQMALGPSNDVGCEIEIRKLRNATAWSWDPTRPIAQQGPGSETLPAARQLVTALAMAMNPAAPDHADQCEQLCKILKAAERGS
jgi:hypothetical protein